MADYIVLEEDGTSRLDLEENTDSVLLEESSPQSGAVSLELAVSFGVAAGSDTPEQHVHWKAGTLTVPAATGTVAVTGLGGEPSAVFFFGTNWLTEDSVVTTGGTGMFRGHAAPKWDDPGTIVQSAATATPPGNQHSMQNAAILMHSSAGTGTNLYGATLSSFDADGFTVNFFTAAAGGYKVVYVAMMGAGNVGAYTGTDTTLSLGWQAGASLLHGAWGGTVIGGTDRTQEFYGGGAYPGGSHLGWRAAGETVYSFPTSANSQYLIYVGSNNPDVVVAQSADFIGPFLNAGNVLAHPATANLNNFVLTTNSNNTGISVVMWDDEDSWAGNLTPATSAAGTSTVSGLEFEPGLVVGYSVSGEPRSNQSDGGNDRGAIAFSVATADFQWCAMADGYLAQGAYQSFQRGFVDSVSGFDVTAHAGTVALTADGFVLTTDVASMGPQLWAWHAFGHPERLFQWIPHIYRRMP